MKNAKNYPTNFTHLGNDRHYHRFSMDYAIKNSRLSNSLQPNHRHIKENRKRDQLLEGND